METDRRVVLSGLRILYVSPAVLIAAYARFPMAIISSIASLTAMTLGRVWLSYILAVWAAGYVYLIQGGIVELIALSIQAILGLAIQSRLDIKKLLYSMWPALAIGFYASLYVYLAANRVPVDIPRIPGSLSNGGVFLIALIAGIFAYSLSYRLASPRATYRPRGLILSIAKIMLPLSIYILTIIPIYYVGKAIIPLILGILAYKIVGARGLTRFKLLAYTLTYYTASHVLGINDQIDQYIRHALS